MAPKMTFDARYSGIGTIIGIIPNMERRSFIRASLLAIGVSGVGLAGCNLVSASSADGPFFNEQRFAVLEAVSETIMPRTDTPGALDAQVPQRLDTLMSNWASPETRESFEILLDEIEAAARAQAGANLASLSADKQLEIVEAFDASRSADPVYRTFKNLVFSLFYLSDPGAFEELRYEHVPGAWEPSIPVTPDTRAYAIDLDF